MEPLAIVLVGVIVFLMFNRKKLGRPEPNLREKFVNNELIQDYIERQGNSLIDKIRNENKDDSQEDIKVVLYVGICENGIDYIGGYASGIDYAVDFKKHNLRPLDKHSERQILAEVVVAGILQKVKSEMPINPSHSNPNVKAIKSTNEYQSGDPKLEIVYTATNKNYIKPQSW